MSGHEPVGQDLYAWVALLAEEVGLDPAAMDVESILDVARETAHGVGRPAVPLTGFFVGYAVGAGGRDRAAFEAAAGRVTALAQEWAERREVTGPSVAGTGTITGTGVDAGAP